jgi:hypothetical protein
MKWLILYGLAVVGFTAVWVTLGLLRDRDNERFR